MRGHYRSAMVGEMTALAQGATGLTPIWLILLVVTIVVAGGVIVFLWWRSLYGVWAQQRRAERLAGVRGRNPQAGTGRRGNAGGEVVAISSADWSAPSKGGPAGAGQGSTAESAAAKSSDFGGQSGGGGDGGGGGGDGDGGGGGGGGGG